METMSKSKPHVSFEFEIEKIVGISSDGRYQVQWAPAWVSKFHLVGCEHLIQEFLQEVREKELNPDPEDHHKISDDVSRLMEENYNEGYLENEGDPVTLVVDIKEENTDMEIATSTANERPNCRISTSTISMSTAPADEFEEYELSHNSSKNVIASDFVQPQDSYTLAFNSPSLLQTDTDSAHECNTCGKKFSCESTLNAHVKTHRSKHLYHSANQWYSCDQCNSWFVKKSLLISHICSEGIERSYNCPYCNSNFEQKDHLDIHLQTHIDTKPFSCELCGKSFKRRYALKTHIRTHTGDKPYSCQVCGKAYSNKSNYNTHTRICSRSIKQNTNKDML